MTYAETARKAFAGMTETVRTALRTDGWINTITGLGTSSDKRTFSSVGGFRPLDPTVLEALYASDDLAAKMVDALPKAALRGGLPVAQDEDGEIQAALLKWDVAKVLRRAATWGRLQGSGYILLGTAGNMSSPLGEVREGGLLYLDVLDRQDLTVDSRYRNPREAKFGEPEFYRIHKVSQDGTVKQNLGERIHESRLIHFGSVLTPDRIKAHNNGHDLSVLQRPYEILRDANDSWSNVMVLFQDLSQAVFKVKGLIAMIANGERDALQNRMEIVNMARSVARAVMIDADDESFEHVGAANVTGVDALLTRVFQRLAAAADMPVTVLLGISPAGLNATGESDIRQWYDKVQEYRTDEIEPRASRLISIVLQSEGISIEGDPEIAWPSLWQYTPDELADQRVKVAASDTAYINAGVLPPEAVALARWGSGAFSPDRLEEVLDFDALQKALDGEMGSLLDPAPEPPAVPVQPGQQPPPAPGTPPDEPPPEPPPEAP